MSRSSSARSPTIGAGFELEGERLPPRLGGVPMLSDHLGGERRQVEGLGVHEALAFGQDKEPRDHVLAAHDGGPDRVGHAPQVVARRLGVGERDVDFGAHDGQRRAQLVRGVGHERALRVEGRFEARQHGVEGVGELAQLVVGALHGDALVKRAGRRALRGHGDLLERTKHAPGDQPAQPDRHRRGHGQRRERHARQAAQKLGDDLVLHRAHERAHRLVAARRRGHAAGEKALGKTEMGRDVPEELAGVVDQHLTYAYVADRDQQEPQGKEHRAVRQREAQSQAGGAPSHGITAGTQRRRPSR